MIRVTRTLALFVLSTLTMAGCATEWKHPTATPQSFDRDNVECAAMGNAAAGSPRYLPGASGQYQTLAAVVNSNDRTAFYEQCMRGRGYSQ